MLPNQMQITIQDLIDHLESERIRLFGNVSPECILSKAISNHQALRWCDLYAYTHQTGPRWETHQDKVLRIVMSNASKWETATFMKPFHAIRLLLWKELQKERMNTA